jgi:hypothetical protein
MLTDRKIIIVALLAGFATAALCGLMLLGFSNGIPVGKAGTGQVADSTRANPSQLAPRREQEPGAAAAAAANEKRNAAADALITEVQKAVKAGDPVQTFDGFLAKIAAISNGNWDRFNPGGVGGKLDSIRTFVTRWQDFLYARSRGNFEAAGIDLRQIIQDATVFPIIPRSELMILLDKINDEGIAADKDFIAPLLQELETGINSAKAAGELDRLMADLNTAQTQEARRHSSRGTVGWVTIQQIRIFALRWQEYLTFLENGKIPDAQMILRALVAENYTDNAVLTKYRSLFIRKLNEYQPSPPNPPPRIQPNTPPPGPAGVTPSVTAPPLLKPEELTLENLGTLRSALPGNSAPANGDHPRLASVLDNLLAIQQQINAGRGFQAFQMLVDGGMPPPAGNYVGQTGAYAPVIAALRNQLFRQSIQLAANTKVQPIGEEDPVAYIKRLLIYEIENRDWPAASTMIDLETVIQAEPADELNRTRRAVQVIAHGRREEGAQHYASAVRFYLIALATKSKMIGITSVQGYLDNIKDGHPDEYALGLKFVNQLPGSQ